MNAHAPNALNTAALIKIAHQTFSEIPDPRKFSGNSWISLSDHLMSGLAIFGLKFPSLLNYDRRRQEQPIQNNLRDLYHVENPPSDTYLRERLDELDPVKIRPVFKKLFSKLQRNKHLEDFVFMDGHYLLSMDGTGQFSSSNVCCEQCCKKIHSNGTVTYYHQMFGGCIVHPDKANVIPVAPEPILNQDGQTKNDCERNAAKRFLEDFRREHPHLKVIVIEDGLSSNAPHIELLEHYKMRYILGAKPGDHKFLFETLESSDETQYHEFTDEKGVHHQFHFLNGTSLNKSNSALKVNVLEYRQTSKGKELNFSWVTNIRITKENVYNLTKGGRARWKVENETFNTLKNLGYNFEHNYGHGKKYLSTVFCLLMMLSFLIDQIQEISCVLFQTARKIAVTYRELWERMRTFFEYLTLGNWDTFYLVVSKKIILNSS